MLLDIHYKADITGKEVGSYNNKLSIKGTPQDLGRSSVSSKILVLNSHLRDRKGGRDINFFFFLKGEEKGKHLCNINLVMFSDLCRSEYPHMLKFMS